jgi:site-specific DNA-methyltransferase (adenine-specific)
MKYQIIQGDNRDTLKTIADNSIDAIVTDPPYGIDFLGKDWDANTGALETYQECLRVLKPGGHIIAFSAARTYHHLAITLEKSGFEIRDQIMWIYSSGFPKAQKVEGFEGWKNGALKPGHEPIALARKPTKLTIEKNMLEYGVGALNIDATRIPAETLTYPANGINRLEFNQATPDKWQGETTTNDKGRFPSNVLGDIPEYQKYFYCPKVSRKERHIGYDTTLIPTDSSGYQGNSNGGNYLQKKQNQSGEQGNNHPTVKPIELMKYLITLITPPGGIVLDPFNGSGSTGIAAVELGYEYIGCELDPAYVEISHKRIEAWNKTANNFEELFSAAE